MGRPQAADARGFLGALFDFSFTSFVTTKIIKVLYVLILVLVSLSALVFTISAFRLSAGFGLLVLVIGDPLFIIVVMAFWRLVLEAFVVVFRMAEDIRALRERGGRLWPAGARDDIALRGLPPAVLHSHQAAAGAAMSHVVIDEVGMPLLIGVWLFLAWAISRGRDAARFGFTSFFLLITMALIIAQAQGGAVYAPADLIAGAAAWLIALAAVVLIFVPASNRYYRQEAAPVAHPAG